MRGDEQTEHNGRVLPPTIFLSEKTAIRLQLGFIAVVIAGITAAVSFLSAMRTDVIAMMTRVEVQEKIIQTLQNQIVDFKIHQQSIDDNLNFLRQAIEEDQRWHRTHVSDK